MYLYMLMYLYICLYMYTNTCICIYKILGEGSEASHAGAGGKFEESY